MIKEIDDAIRGLQAVSTEYRSDAHSIGYAIAYLQIFKTILQNNEKLLELQSLKNLETK
jgi:hypothetical protein